MRRGKFRCLGGIQQLHRCWPKIVCHAATWKGDAGKRQETGTFEQAICAGKTKCVKAISHAPRWTWCSRFYEPSSTSIFSRKIGTSPSCLTWAAFKLQAAGSPMNTNMQQEINHIPRQVPAARPQQGHD